MKHLLFALAAACAAAAPVPAAASEARAAEPLAATSAPAPVILPGTDVRTIRAQADGRSYRLYLSIPKTAPPPGGFPVLYLLDAEAYFPLFAQGVRLQSRRPDVTGVAPLVIAGIGHDTDELFNTDLRYRDFTPATPDGKPPKPIGKFKIQPSSGEADRFLRFIDNEIKPLVEGLAPVNREKQTLFGHSLGGLFSLHVLATGSTSFQNLVAVSPSVWWDGDRVLEELRTFPERGKAGAAVPRVLVLVGGRELPDMRAGAASAADLLKHAAAGGPALLFEEVAYADHGSVIPTAMNRTLRFASGAEPRPEEKKD